MNDILEQIRLQASLSDEETAASEFSNIKEKYVIDKDVDYPEPEYLIRIGDVPTLPKGNLVAISAKWKNGKTFFCDILSAIFLGSDIYANCENLVKQGKVRFIDTEQARNDTSRILKTIMAITPEERHGDIEVACLRSAEIDTDEQSKEISRYEFVRRTIELEHPDLVIVDGIADLIYNYNDVNESQIMVNNLATLANDHNCCIVVVMHQNKGSHDKTMKGHIGTMLYQKCSDVFQVEKHGTLFVVTHPVSRHRQSEGLVFKLDANAVPMDATADRQLQVEIESQQAESNLREMFGDLIPEDGTPVKRKDIVEGLVKNYGFKKFKCYDLIKKALKQGWLVEIDSRLVKLRT
jgi:hypothetical protein